MEAGDVLRLLRAFRQCRLAVVIDGGWAVDAVLGGQSRPHSDLDIALPHSQVTRLRHLMRRLGYAEVRRDDSWACNFVLADRHGRAVDVHSHVIGPDGLSRGGVPYVTEQLAGRGRLLGQPVPVIRPDWLVRFKDGTWMRPKDLRDLRRLHRRTGVPLSPDQRAALSGQRP